MVTYNRSSRPSRSIGRRYALRAGAAGLGGLAFLAACGGDEDSGSSSSGSSTSSGTSGGSGGTGGATASSLITQVQETTSSAKPGGIFEMMVTEDIGTVDAMPAPNASAARRMSGFVYSRLLKFKPGKLAAPVGEIEGDLAESFEVSGDGLQITLKLRPDAKWDPRAPTNGRAVEAQDILFSWKKFSETSGFRGDLHNGTNSGAPIETMTAPDARTVLVKLVRPDSMALALLASAGHLTIQPREADGGFDTRTDARGSGPFMIESLRGSVSAELKRNPNWYVKDRPFFDGVRIAVLPEYAQQLAQFKAGSLWVSEAGYPVVRQEDVLQTKKDHPKLLMYSSGTFPQAAQRYWWGIQKADSPFRDERVRRAYSMLIDRDLLIDTFGDTESFEKEGISKERRWSTAIPTGWQGAWLDPKSAEFGPNGKNYAYDVAEAKKLLTAAGFPNGFEHDLHVSATPTNPIWTRMAEALAGVVAKGGIKGKVIPQDDANFTTPILRGKGNFAGMAMSSSSAQPDPALMAFAHYHSKGAMGQHQLPFEPEPDVDAMIESMRAEFDINKRFKILHDFQKLMAGKVRMLLWAGDATTYDLAWPWVGNTGVFPAYGTYGWPTESLVHRWYDASKR